MGLSLLLLVGFVLVEVLALLFPVSFMVTKGVLFADDMTHSRGNKRVFIIDGVSLLNYEPVWDGTKETSFWTIGGV